MKPRENLFLTTFPVATSKYTYELSTEHWRSVVREEQIASGLIEKLSGLNYIHAAALVCSLLSNDCADKVIVSTIQKLGLTKFPKAFVA